MSTVCLLLFNNLEYGWPVTVVDTFMYVTLPYQHTSTGFSVTVALVVSSDFVLVDVLVRSPRKLFIYIMKYDFIVSKYPNNI